MAIYENISTSKGLLQIPALLEVRNYDGNIKLFTTHIPGQRSKYCSST